MFNNPDSAHACIYLNNKQYNVMFFHDKIGVCQKDSFGKVLYMTVEPYQNMNRHFKLLKTKIKAIRNAADVYRYLVDCSAFDQETEKALAMIEHIKKYGHGIR